jgi:hypothetical protein
MRAVSDRLVTRLEVIDGHAPALVLPLAEEKAAVARDITNLPALRCEVAALRLHGGSEIGARCKGPPADRSELAGNEGAALDARRQRARRRRTRFTIKTIPAARSSNPRPLAPPLIPGAQRRARIELSNLPIGTPALDPVHPRPSHISVTPFARPPSSLILRGTPGTNIWTRNRLRDRLGFFRFAAIA